MRSKAQQLLQGQKIVGVDDDCTNELRLMLEDGRTIVIEAHSLYVGNGMTVPSLRASEEGGEPDARTCVRKDCPVCGGPES